MRRALRISPTVKHRLALGVEPLEHRSLLSGSSVVKAAAGGVQDVKIQVPSTYISQHASTLDVTLVRGPVSGRRPVAGPLTVDFSAALGSLSRGAQPSSGASVPQFTPVDESVTFAPGQTTVTVVVPINAGAPNPGLVPVALTVTPPARHVAKSNTTVYLVSGPDAVPPSIINVHMQKKGIVVTFSKPMAPATVKDIHNYRVEYIPSQQFTLADLTGVGLIQQQVNNGPSTVELKRATYDSSTNTVTLIPKFSLPTSGTYRISNPSSLDAKRARPHKARPLTDLQGNVLNPGGVPVAGAFSISISSGHPFVQSQPIVSD